MLGPNYRETPPAVPAHWQAGQDASAGLKAVDPQTLKDWWKSFGYTGLDRLMKQALAGNLDLKIALTRIDQARAERSGTRAELFPKVNLGIGAARYENPLPGLVPGTRFNFFQLGFDTLWEIDLFGRQRRRLEAASADLDAADEQYRFALVTLTAEVARSYIEYRNLQNQQIITRANLTAQQQILSLTETLFREGVGTRFEVVLRKQIETLQEQLTAVIHHAVTEGIDPQAKLKPSGVDWLGDVPEGWETGDLKHFVSFTVGWTPPTGQDHLYNGEFPWCTIGDIDSEIINETEKMISATGVVGSRIQMTKKGSLLFSFKLSIGQVAFAGIDMFTNEAIASFPPQSGYIPRFMFYSFPVYIVENAQTNIYGAKLLNQFPIKNAPIVRPSVCEQEDIVIYVDQETSKLDTLISKYQRELELLSEYRASLISYAVTGKIDVRGLV